MRKRYIFDKLYNVGEEKVKYLILGAGAAGLAFACQLKRNGEDDFLVLEREKNAGGLCRSVEVDGSPFDIGGGHFLDVRHPKVNDFLFSYMPKDEWNLFKRDSRIEMGEYTISHPFEANIWQLPLERQVEYLESIAKAGCNNDSPMPERFIEWIQWKLGEKIATDYMLPYNRKMFADELNDLGTYWLEKLPNVSFADTLLSCLSHKPYGTQPGHAEFYYPKHYGYGEVWNRMAETLGEKIVYEQEVYGIDFDTKEVITADGSKYHATHIITTIPWRTFLDIKGMPQDILDLLGELKSGSIETRYCKDNLNTEAQWLYFPDEKLPYHRILVRHNFCAGSRGYWMETRGERVPMFKEDSEYSYMNQYAYPLNTLSKPMVMSRLLSFAKAKNVYGLGRWGEHCHYNSDLTVELAMNLADSFLNDAR